MCKRESLRMVKGMEAEYYNRGKQKYKREANGET